MVRCNAIPAPEADPSQSIPANGVPFGNAGNVASQFSPSQNPPPPGFGSNTRPNYQLMPFPTLYNQQPPQQQQQPQQFGGQPSYPYLNLYAGNSAGSSPQMLPYYGQFRPFQGGQGAYGGSASLMPYSSRFQNNLQQFGQQPLTQTLFDRMDTKQADEQEKKSTQQ